MSSDPLKDLSGGEPQAGVFYYLDPWLLRRPASTPLRCRMASYITNAADTEALREAMRPRMEMRARASHRSLIKRERPLPFSAYYEGCRLLVVHLGEVRRPLGVDAHRPNALLF